MKTEKTLLIIVVLASLLKMLHIPGGSVLLVLSLLGLALCYFPLGFYFLSDKSYKENTLTSVLFGWLLSVCFIGIMFRIMHWPGAMIMNIVGTMSALPLSIFAYLKHKSSNQENRVYFRNLLIRSIILFIVSLVMSFVKIPF
ncbi:MULTISPECIES: hypothetical protein [unclassified Flavobacterium]|uniref:hypothetical protein n=1 Tax=unclassified Flavobacterium TaxID=196869 RepID=UPI0012928184|nr:MULTISPECIES: hypothetical protein [unclassified Flavobacterium]MQP52244.1 hypothetical protein [Flavobacterium sp. LMO9]MQP62314.1 hypothetical protein [Flavobacterium sp. LMO6]